MVKTRYEEINLYVLFLTLTIQNSITFYQNYLVNKLKLLNSKIITCNDT